MGSSNLMLMRIFVLMRMVGRESRLIRKVSFPIGVTPFLLLISQGTRMSSTDVVLPWATTISQEVEALTVSRGTLSYISAYHSQLT